jgi:hypothetical protein
MNAKQGVKEHQTRGKKTLNNMRECNKQRTREHKQCVRKYYSMNEKTKKTYVVKSKQCWAVF